MAILKHRIRRKNSAGSYDVVHFETESGLVVRPNNETVETTLTKTLRMKNIEDTVPSFNNKIDADTLQGKTAAELVAGYAKLTELESVKTSVSEGKKLIAAAVTDKGVETAADATFKTMADNIENISTGGYGGTLQCTAATNIAAGDLLILDSMSENFKSSNGYRDSAYRLDSGFVCVNGTSSYRYIDCIFVDKAGTLHKWTHRDGGYDNPSAKFDRYANDVFKYYDSSVRGEKYVKIDRVSGTIIDATSAEATGKPSPKTRTDSHAVNVMYRTKSSSRINIDSTDGSWCGNIIRADITEIDDAATENGTISIPLLVETDIGEVVLVNYSINDHQYIVMYVPDSNGSYAPNIAYKASEYTGIDWNSKMIKSAAMIPFIGKAVTSAASGEALTVVNMGPYHPGAFINT